MDPCHIFLQNEGLDNLDRGKVALEVVQKLIGIAAGEFCEYRKYGCCLIEPSEDAMRYRQPAPEIGSIYPLSATNRHWYDFHRLRLSGSEELPARLFVVQERLLAFVLYGMAVCLGMKPSVQAASTRLCCEIIIHFIFTLPEPLLSANYCMLFCKPVASACSTAVVPTLPTGPDFHSVCYTCKRN